MPRAACRGVEEVSRRCRGGVWKCLGGVEEVSGSVEEVSRRCLGGVWKCLGGV